MPFLQYIHTRAGRKIDSVAVLYGYRGIKSRYFIISGNTLNKRAHLMDHHHEVMLSEQTYIISTQPKNHPTLDTLSLMVVLNFLQLVVTKWLSRALRTTFDCKMIAQVA